LSNTGKETEFTNYRFFLKERYRNFSEVKGLASSSPEMINIMQAIPFLNSLLFAVLLAAAEAVSTTPPVEWLAFNPVGTGWDFRHADKKTVPDFYSKVSVVPEGQTTSIWQEMFTLQTLEKHSLQDSRESFMEKLNDFMKKQYRKNLSVTVIRTTANSLLFETKIRSRKTAETERQELIIIIDGTDKRWVMSYTKKGGEMPEETRKLWINSFVKAKVIPRP
jgi:hypothetical protein